MNRPLSATLVTLAALVLAGCAAGSAPTVQHPVGESSSKRLDDSISCNLGERYDAAVGSVRAHYEQPADADYVREHYGDWVANESCSDAQILAWQELRRETGESEEICRVVYYDDHLANLVYPIGCAVPVLVVTDASR